MDRRRFFGRTLTIGGLVVSGGAIGSVITACGGGEETAATPSGAGRLEKVPFQLIWLQNVEFGGYYAAIKNGYYAAEGMEIDLISGGPQIDPISIVASGRALAGCVGGFSVIAARGRGAPVKTIGATFQQTPFSLMSLAETPIRALTDCAGKTIAIPDGGRAVMTALVKRAGVDPADVRFVPVGADPSILIQKQVDGIMGYSTNQGTTLRSRGAKLFILSQAEMGDPSPGDVIFTTDEVITRKRDLLVRLMRATVKGWQFAVDNPEAVAKMAVEEFGLKGLDLSQQVAEAKEQAKLVTLPNARRNGLLAVDTDATREALRLAQEAGLTKKPLAVEEVVDPSIVRDAHA